LRVIYLLLLVILSSCVARAQCTPVPNQTPAELSCVAESPLVAGGSGTDWGKWFEITSAAVPDGYIIVSVSFRLEGPHPCTADITYPLPPPAGAPTTTTTMSPKSTETSNAQNAQASKELLEILHSINLPTLPTLKAIHDGGTTNPFGFDQDRINALTQLASMGLITAIPQGAGSWAQCDEIKKSKSSVTWRFRFQGWTSEDRTVGIGKNSEIDPSCKQKDKPTEKQQYCDQTSVHLGWTNKDEAIRQKAKLLTIAVQQ
jgi:hypothetical protein